MRLTREPLAGVLTIELDRFSDARGFFVERFNEALFAGPAFAGAGLPSRFCQDNHSRSLPGVIRGLHFQTDPPQGKLVGVVRGRIWDVIVDIRPDSPTFGDHLASELSDEDATLLWIPPGMAHGFCVLGSEAADVVYKADRPYNPAGDGGILWSDPDLGIRWPVTDPTLSDRDRRLPSFASYRANPHRW